MAEFETLDAAGFDDALRRSKASPLFRAQYARFKIDKPYGAAETAYAFHSGPLKVEGDFRAPGFITLIAGDLTVGGLVDLTNPEQGRYDEGGAFIVLGNLFCGCFSGHYGKCSFVDGTLEAKELLVNAYEDSSLVVTGDLRTRFFYGDDIWAEVGGAARMDYGVGYCLPIDYVQAALQSVRPLHDEAMSRRMIGQLDTDYPQKTLVDLYKAKRRIVVE